MMQNQRMSCLSVSHNNITSTLSQLSWAELSITIGQVTATKITNEWILILIVIHMPITYVKAITEAINQLDAY
jgi:hypothetical protein